MEEFIYYIRDNQNRPMITVCLAQDENGNFARGMAICSLRETGPNKKIGRMYARGRAYRAFKKASMGKESQSSPVNRQEAYDSVLKATRPILGLQNFQAKSLYNPPLNVFEQQILAKKEPAIREIA